MLKGYMVGPPSPLIYLMSELNGRRQEGQLANKYYVDKSRNFKAAVMIFQILPLKRSNHLLLVVMLQAIPLLTRRSCSSLFINYMPLSEWT